ncbi:hypothetical protein ACLB1N_30195 [Escherichia coli]
MSVHDVVRQEMLTIYRENDYRISGRQQESIMLMPQPEASSRKEVTTSNATIYKMTVLPWKLRDPVDGE